MSGGACCFIIGIFISYVSVWTVFMALCFFLSVCQCRNGSCSICGYPWDWRPFPFFVIHFQLLNNFSRPYRFHYRFKHLHKSFLVRHIQRTNILWNDHLSQNIFWHIYLLVVSVSHGIDKRFGFNMVFNRKMRHRRKHFLLTTFFFDTISLVIVPNDPESIRSHINQSNSINNNDDIPDTIIFDVI